MREIYFLYKVFYNIYGLDRFPHIDQSILGPLVLQAWMKQ